MFFPDRRYAYKATCTALLPVRRLSFGLGIISFWLSFGLCLKILFAPCGCRRAYCGCWRTYCGPHCGRESARVLASLIGSSPSGVRHLSRVCSSVWGPVGVAHPFHPSLLLGGVLVSLCGGPSWRSLVMSVPSAFSLHRSRLSIPFALSPLSCHVFADGVSPFRAVALEEGRLPMRWVPSEPMGLAVAPPISPYTGPGQSP